MRALHSASIASILSILALSACGSSVDPGGESTATPESDVSEAPIEPSGTVAASDTPSAVGEVPPASETPADGSATGGNLSAYVGKWPFDEVNGVKWNDNPAVIAGIRNTVKDPGIRKAIMETPGPASEIAMYNGKVASWSCQQHNCGDHQWNVMVDPRSGATDVCYYNAEKLPDKSHWYLSDGKTETRAGNCAVT